MRLLPFFTLSALTSQPGAKTPAASSGRHECRVGSVETGGVVTAGGGPNNGTRAVIVVSAESNRLLGICRLAGSRVSESGDGVTPQILLRSDCGTSGEA